MCGLFVRGRVEELVGSADFLESYTGMTLYVSRLPADDFLDRVPPEFLSIAGRRLGPGSGPDATVYGDDVDSAVLRRRDVDGNLAPSSPKRGDEPLEISLLHDHDVVDRNPRREAVTLARGSHITECEVRESHVARSVEHVLGQVALES